MPDTRIIEVRVRPFHHPRLQQLIVEVVASDGTVGTGECWWGIAAGDQQHAAPFAPQAAAVEMLADRCVGQPSANIERLTTSLIDWAYRYGDGGVITSAISGIDIALWDLLGKQLDVPALQLLGGRAHDRLPAYASLPPYGSLERVVEQCTRARAAGFEAFKLHEHDIEIVLGTRHALGPSATLMVDVNGYFDVDGAITFGRRMAPADVLWYEEPVSPMRHIGAIEAVAQGQPVALAGGENEYTLADFDRLLRTGAVRWLQPEVTKIGGLTTARKVGVLAELHAVALSPHNFRIGPASAAATHWAFASPGARWLEIPWLTDAAPWPCGASPPEVDDGTVGAPTEPGVGPSIRR